MGKAAREKEARQPERTMRKMQPATRRLPFRPFPSQLPFHFPDSWKLRPPLRGIESHRTPETIEREAFQYCIRRIMNFVEKEVREGVSTRELRTRAGGARPEAAFVLTHRYDRGFTTNWLEERHSW